MKSIVKYLVTLIYLCSIFSTAVTAQEIVANNNIQSSLQNISITGFGDFLAVFDNDNSDEFFQIGQAEIGFEYKIDQLTNLALALSYSEQSIEIGSFYYEKSYQLNNPNHKIKITVGQFDIPFGIDWYVYPSIERSLITAPNAVSETHDGWNDLGCMLQFETEKLSASLFAANGYSHAHLDREESEVQLEHNYALGTNVHYTLFDNLTLGSSFAFIDDKNNMHDLTLFGADIQYEYKNLALKSEFIQDELLVSGNEDLDDNGFYFQAKYSFNKFYLISRVSQHQHLDYSKHYQYSNGAGYQLQENVIARIEWKHDSIEHYDKMYLQFAFGY